MTEDMDRCAIARAFAYASGAEIGPHPHLSLRDLCPEVQIIIGKHVYGLLDERDRRRRDGQSGGNLTDNELYLSALEHFGVDCPHVWKGQLVYSAVPSVYSPAFIRKGAYAHHGLECERCRLVQVEVEKEKFGA